MKDLSKFEVPRELGDSSPFFCHPFFHFRAISQVFYYCTVFFIFYLFFIYLFYLFFIYFIIYFLFIFYLFFIYFLFIFYLFFIFSPLKAHFGKAYTQILNLIFLRGNRILKFGTYLL